MSWDYEEQVQAALRGVVRDVLRQVQEEGLGDQRHFYVSVQTSFPGVEFPGFVQKANPNEITIVLQHQFWDLDVSEEGFSVTLTFQDKPYRVHVPFDALVSFMDPGVQFGLHFTPPKQKYPAEVEAPADADSSNVSAKVIPFSKFRK
jgi:hypothetical protein